MKLNIKYLFMGMIISISISISVCFAKGIFEEISVDRNTVKIFVNDKEIVSDNFVYNGTTYIPLRETGEQLKKYVYWDQKANCARIFGGVGFETKKLSKNEFSFNNIKLLSGEEEVRKILGNPQAMKHEKYELLLSTNNAYDIWLYNGFELVFDKGTLMEIVINGSNYITHREIKVGDDYGKVLHEYGNGNYNDIHKWLLYSDEYEEGKFTTTALVFEINDNKKVSKIRYGITGY